MISVCMATYNGEKYIKEQLESILKQLNDDDEVIISDDGSKDKTLDIIKKIEDKRIKIYINKGLHGFTHNFENALRKADGEYIFLSDQDDIWLDNKVSVAMKALEKFDFITHDCITIDSEMRVLSKSRFEEFNIKSGFWNHMLKSRYLGCCMAFRRCVLDLALPFPKRDDLVEHDIWLAAVAFKYFNYKLISEPLIYYKRHGKNASDGGFSKGYSMLNKLNRRVYRLYHILKLKKRISGREAFKIRF